MAVTIRLHADFNGLFGDLLCLSHSDTAIRRMEARSSCGREWTSLAFEADVSERTEDGLLIGRDVSQP